jgi:hypothetical protein
MMEIKTSPSKHMIAQIKRINIFLSISDPKKTFFCLLMKTNDTLFVVISHVDESQLDAFISFLLYMGILNVLKCLVGSNALVSRLEIKH